MTYPRAREYTLTYIAGLATCQWLWLQRGKYISKCHCGKMLTAAEAVITTTEAVITAAEAFWF